MLSAGVPPRTEEPLGGRGGDETDADKDATGLTEGAERGEALRQREREENSEREDTGQF